MGQAAVARHRLEAMEVWTRSLCRAATPRRRPGPGGANRRQPTWPLAAQSKPCAYPCSANCLLRLARPRHTGAPTCRLIHRTAVYGPVRTVVWEGRSREAPPYPDFSTGAARSRRPGLTSIGRRRNTPPPPRLRASAEAIAPYTPGIPMSKMPLSELKAMLAAEKADA